mgnify:CR=1 FL=1
MNAEKSTKKQLLIVRAGTVVGVLVDAEGNLNSLVLGRALMTMPLDQDEPYSLWHINPDGTREQYTPQAWEVSESGSALVAGGIVVYEHVTFHCVARALPAVAQAGPRPAVSMGARVAVEPLCTIQGAEPWENALRKTDLGPLPLEPCARCGHSARAHDRECMWVEPCADMFPLSEPEGCDCTDYVDPDDLQPQYRLEK